MTHAVGSSKRHTTKLQLKCDPKDVPKIMDSLPRDPLLDLMENSGPGRKPVAQEAILRAYRLSKLAETWVPESPHAVYRLLKEYWRGLAGSVQLSHIPCWETFRKRFKLLDEEYGNEVILRQLPILRCWGREASAKRPCLSSRNVSIRSSGMRRIPGATTSIARCESTMPWACSR